MKSFGPIDIKNRLVQYLRNDSNWNGVLDDSVITSIFAAYGEETSGLVRYFEQLLKEAKWSLAQNTTSLLTQATRMGYYQRRWLSAQGTITISHNNALLNAGITDIYSQNDFATKLNSSFGSSTFIIPKGTSFTNPATGYTYLSTTSVTYYGPSDSNSPNAPLGSYFATVPVIEGTSASTTFTLVGLPSESVTLPITNMENAGLPLSSQFFSVSATLPSSSASISLTQYDDISLAPSNTYAFMCRVVTTGVDVGKIAFTFGNGSSGFQLPGSTRVTVSYLATHGAGGNITTNYVLHGTKILNNTTFYYSNIPADITGTAGILGGLNSPTLSEIRSVAPTYYTTKSSIVSTSEYKNFISLIIGSVQSIIVYNGSTFDSASGTLLPTINYSYVNTLGKYDLSVDALVQSSLIGLNNPQDLVRITSPNFIRMRINVSCVAPTTQNGSAPINNAQLKASITNNINSSYGTATQSFNKSIDFSNVNQITTTTGGLLVSSFIEAVEDMPLTSFIPDTLNTANINYIYNFQFDNSFARLKGFEEGVLACLRIDVKFSCLTTTGTNLCGFTGSDGVFRSYSRSLFLVRDTSNPNPSYTYQLTVAQASFAGPLSSSSNYSVTYATCNGGTTATLTFLTQTVAPFVNGQWIYITGSSISGYTGVFQVTACTVSTVTYLVTTTQSTVGTSTTVIGNIYPTVGIGFFGYYIYIPSSSLNSLSSVATALNGQSIGNIGTISANTTTGVLTISFYGTRPTNQSIDTTQYNGISINTTAGFFTNYKVLQYSYDDVERVYPYMDSTNLTRLFTNNPTGILSNDTTLYPYIPFVINFDYSSLNPSNIVAHGLGVGSISVPTQLAGVANTPKYIDWSIAKDISTVNIQARAIPFNQTSLVPAVQNSFIQIDQRSNTYPIDDINVVVRAN